MRRKRWWWAASLPTVRNGSSDASRGGDGDGAHEKERKKGEKNGKVIWVFWEKKLMEKI